jgi:hypothetical protein
LNHEALFLAPLLEEEMMVGAWTRAQARTTVAVDGGGGDVQLAQAASEPGSSSAAKKKVVVPVVAKQPTKDRHTKVDGRGW